MKINATFFVQIINFWATYWVLSKVLFKPFVEHIAQKDFLRRKLLKKLSVQDEEIVHLNEQKIRELTEFKTRLHNQYVAPKPLILDAQSMSIYDQQPEKIDALTITIKNVLVKAISNDH